MKASIIRRIVMMLLPLTFSSVAIAQEDFQKIFDDFQKANEKEFADFRDKANAQYVEFLKQGWEWFTGKAPMPKPVHEEPVVPPVVLPDEDRDKELDDKEIPYEEVLPEPEPSPVPGPIAPIEEVPVPVSKYVTFSMYGTEFSVRYDPDTKPFIRTVSVNPLSEFWEELYMSDGVDNLIYDCLLLRKGIAMCDWAFYRFTEALGHALYPYSQDEAAMFQAYVLTQSGFRLRLGYSKDDEHYHFITATDCDMYEYSFWELETGNYYLLDGSEISHLGIINEDFPESVPMCMAITQEILLAENLTEGRLLTSEQYKEASATVSTNLNLLSFYDDYPATFVNEDTRTRWRFYANVPLGRTVRESLYPQLEQAIAGKTEYQAADLLLNFVQTAFEYGYDEEIWGTDRTFFADESIYYPYCDCEDRSVLYSRLVRDIMGLDVVLIYYPGHLATAVKFTQPVNGDYITYDGDRYTICDPTYINAPVGMTMPDMDNATAFILPL